MDSGTQLEGKVFSAVCASLVTRSMTKTAYHLQMNGQTEPYNKIILSRLRYFISKHQDD